MEQRANQIRSFLASLHQINLPSGPSLLSAGANCVNMARALMDTCSHKLQLLMELGDIIVGRWELVMQDWGRIDLVMAVSLFK